MAERLILRREMGWSSRAMITLVGGELAVLLLREVGKKFNNRFSMSGGGCFEAQAEQSMCALTTLEYFRGISAESNMAAAGSQLFSA